MRAAKDTDQNFSYYACGTDGLCYTEAYATSARIDGLPGGEYLRAPKEWLPRFSEMNRMLCANTSGGVIRFVTNSPRVGLRVKLRGAADLPHMPRTGVSGVDIYLGGAGARKYVNTLKPFADSTEYEGGTLLPGGNTEVMVYLPLYNGVSSVEIGVEPGCTVFPPPAYAVEKPVIFYGSSITQGGCACRASTDYPARLCRALDANMINLGFSGSAKGEIAMAKYIAGLPMSCFVYDYDQNAPTAQHLRETHLPFLREILTAQPGIPVVFMTRTDAVDRPEDHERRAIIHETYEWALKQGCPAAFLDGAPLIGGEDPDGCTVDGHHPNDLGFFRMAEALEPLVRDLFGRK
jgi:hypothetical protein